MDMTDDALPRVSPDDLAAHALDAHDPDDASRIAALVRDVPDLAETERTLRAAAGEIAVATVADLAPGAGLRSRVLAEARRRHGAAEVVAGASPIEVHRTELSRAILLLRDLAPGDWARPVDPPELVGWTVRDLAVHLVANESLLAERLGVPVAGITETATDNEGRTAQAHARHRGRRPAAAVAELETAAEAADTEVTSRGEDRLDEPIDWWGGPAATGIVLLVRAFETWTHADDIRRAVGAGEVPPPPASLLTMTHAGCGLVPGLLAARDAYHPGRLARFRFPDLGDAAWDVDLGVIGGVRPAGEGDVDVEIEAEAVPFCRGISARLPAEGLRYTATGDEALAAEVVDALPALAVL
jgi:uncharacterized protein (TIGR03083 family)